MRIYQVCINYAVKNVENIADNNLQIFHNLHMLKNHILFSNSVTSTIPKVYKFTLIFLRPTYLHIMLIYINKILRILILLKSQFYSLQENI